MADSSDGKIRSRHIVSGDKCEGTWLSDFDSTQIKRGVYIGRFKDSEGNFHRERKNETDEYVSFRIEDDPCLKDRPNRFGIAPAVKQDTMPALRHPVTGHMYDSKSAYMQCNKRHGLEIVDNPQSEARDGRINKIDDSVVLDRIERAESIYSDPSKLRARQNENMERLARHEKLIVKKTG